MGATKPMLVGGFALGGSAVAVTALLFFGSTHLFTSTVPAVVVFDGSVSGLAIGSPVTFRGVKIGNVKAMKVRIDSLHHTGLIPVYLELTPQRILWSNGSARNDRSDLQQAVQSGLRAQLTSESLITGQLSVDLDFHPGAPAVASRLAGDLLEIPTVPSELQDLKSELHDLDLPQLAAQTHQVLASMQRVLDVAGTKIGPLADSLRTTLDTTTATVTAVQTDAARTLAQINQLSIATQTQVTANGQELERLIQTAGLAAAQAEKLVASLNLMTDQNSPVRNDLQASLRDLAASANSLRTFTRNLERNPAGTLLGNRSR